MRPVYRPTCIALTSRRVHAHTYMCEVKEQLRVNGRIRPHTHRGEWRLNETRSGKRGRECRARINIPPMALSNVRFPSATRFRVRLAGVRSSARPTREPRWEGTTSAGGRGDASTRRVTVAKTTVSKSNSKSVELNHLRRRLEAASRLKSARRGRNTWFKGCRRWWGCGERVWWSFIPCGVIK